MNNQQLDYIVIGGNTPGDLTDKVQSLMAQGWKVAGGVGLQGSYTQAMFLEKEQTVKEYTIVDEFDPNTFVREVNNMLQQGWVLLGSASVAHDITPRHGELDYGARFVQTMVKYES